MDVAQVVFIQDNQLLMALRQNVEHSNNLWAFPGGRVEQGESLAAAAQRECLEEVGVCPTLLEGPISLPDQDGNTLHFFVCRRWQGEHQNLEPQLCAQLEWFPSSELPGNTIANTDSVVRYVSSIIQTKH